MMRLLVPLAALALLAAPARAADNYPIKDGDGTSRTMRAKDVGGILHPMSVPTDPTGAAYATGNGLPVRQDGSWIFGITGAIPAGANAIGSVTVTTSALPAGAATSAAQATGNTSLGSIDGKLPPKGAATAANAMPVTIASDQGAIGSVTVTTSALPAGAATSAAQATGNASLGSIDGKLPAKGAATTANALPVTIASDQGAIGSVTVATSALPTGAATSANQATGNTSLGSIDGKLPAKGAATTANALPVTIASDQGAIGSVTVATSALPTGAATSAAQSTGNASLATIATAVTAATPAGENHVGQVGGHVAVAVASLTRPANTTAYAAGQLVANSTTAGSVSALQLAVARVTGGSGVIRRARLTTSATTLTNGSFDLLLYRPGSGGACPVSAAGDGAAYSTDSALGYLGRIPVTLDQAFTDGAKGIGVPAIGSEITFDVPAGYLHLCVFLRATAAYAPASGATFTVALEAHQN